VAPPTPFIDAEALRVNSPLRFVEIHERLGSTNDRAAELSRTLANDQLPALVVARHQTAGRGRGANRWWSADGSLTFSLLINPAGYGLTPSRWPQLSLTAAVAVCDVLRPLAPQMPLGIKWPNDVFLNAGKISGILVESPGGSAPARDRLIIGVGMNVNNPFHSAPRDSGPFGISLRDVAGHTFQLQQVLTKLLAAIFRRTGQLIARDPNLRKAWQSLNLWKGQPVCLEAGGLRSEGVCIEIADDAAIIVDTAFGRKRFYSGSLRLAE
jgi:BirA family biotin operon repressor/biotin-[acetyl-CoA-carboxylase] ligase